MTMRYTYPAVLAPDDGQIAVSFPDLPGARSFGATREEVLAHAVDALETALSFYVDERRPLPKPGRAKRGQIVIEASPLGQVKLALYDAMRAQDIGKAELARRLDCHLPQVDRLLDLAHASKMEQLTRALSAVGKRLVVDVEDAA